MTRRWNTHRSSVKKGPTSYSINCQNLDRHNDCSGCNCHCHAEKGHREMFCETCNGVRTHVLVNNEWECVEGLR